MNWNILKPTHIFRDPVEHIISATIFDQKEYDILYEKILVEKNKDKLLLIYRQLEEIILTYSPIIPLYYDMSVRLKQKNIVGLKNNALNMLDLKQVYKK